MTKDLVLARDRRKISKTRYLNRRLDRFKKYDALSSKRSDTHMVFCTCEVDTICKCNYTGRDDSDVVINMDTMDSRYYYQDYKCIDVDGSITDIFNVSDHYFFSYYKSFMNRQMFKRHIDSYHIFIKDSTIDDTALLYRSIEHENSYCDNLDASRYRYGGFGRYLDYLHRQDSSSRDTTFTDKILRYKGRYSIIDIIKHISTGLRKIGDSTRPRHSIFLKYRHFLTRHERVKIFKIIRMVMNRPKVYVYSLYIPTGCRIDEIKNALLDENVDITLEDVYPA